MSLFPTKLTPWLLILSTVVAVSPLIHAFSPVQGNIISIMALLIILVIKSSWRGIGEKYFFWCCGIIFIAFIPTLYWHEPRLMLIPVYLVLSILVISVLNKNDIRAFVGLLSRLVMLLLLGAVFGTLYAYFGGTSILEYINQDGRLGQLYLTTLTNSQFENFIRPSGIFDEPGALSYVTCLIAALRHVLGCNKKSTWTLLMLGFITMSVAHLIYVLLHALEEFKSHRRIKDVLIVAGAIAIFSWILLIFVQPIQEILSASLFSRFTDDTLGTLGQDRITTLLNAFGYIDIHTFMFGLDSDCAIGLANCTVDKGFENYGDNPLTLLVHWGWFLAFPYYLGLIYLAINSMRQWSFVSFGILLMLLQRPYTMSYGYSMLIVLTIFVLIDKHTINREKKIRTIPSTSDAIQAA